MPHMKKIVYSSILTVILWPTFVSASLIDWEEDFDSYVTGELNGQGLWLATSTQFNIVDTYSVSSNNSLHRVGAGDIAYKITSYDLNNEDSVILSGYLKVANNTGDAVFGAHATMSSIYGLCQIGYSGANQRYDLIRGNGSIVTNTALGYSYIDTDWHFAELEIDFVGSQCRGRIDGGAWSGYQPFLGGLTNALILGVSTDFDGWIDSISLNGFGSTITRIISLTPENGTTTSNPVNFTLNAWINPSDVVGTFGLLKVRVYLHNIDRNVLFGTAWLSPNDIVLYDEDITDSGLFSFSTTTPIGEGNYEIYASLTRHWLIDGTEYDSEHHQFIVGQGTFLGTINQNIADDLNTFWGNQTATSTEGYASHCSPIKASDTFGITYNTDYSIISCMAFLFVPDSSEVYETISQLKENVLTHFPLGYFTDFITLISSTTPKSLNILEATIPNSLPCSGCYIHLDLDNSLDMLLNATSGPYISATEDDTRTLYEITEEYWEIIVNLGVLFYILGRIVNSFNIPLITTSNIESKFESTNDRNLRNISHAIRRRKIQKIAKSKIP